MIMLMESKDATQTQSCRRSPSQQILVFGTFMRNISREHTTPDSSPSRFEGDISLTELFELTRTYLSPLLFIEEPSNTMMQHNIKAYSKFRFTLAARAMLIGLLVAMLASFLLPCSQKNKALIYIRNDTIKQTRELNVAQRTSFSPHIL